MERILPLPIGFVNRKQKFSLLLIFLFLFFNNACIQKFTPDLKGFEPSQLIVVEGQITDEEGPFRVKISKPFAIDNNQIYGPPVYGADVQIFDDKGNHYQLYYTIEGWYETENKKLKGVVGNTYTLSITTEDGTQYESTPVLMLDVPEIDNLYFEENEIEKIVDLEVVREAQLDILVDAKDTKGETEYWKWDFVETWEVHTPKDSVHILFEPIGAPDFIVVANMEFRKGYPRKDWDNNKEKCWVTVSSTNILIESKFNNTVNDIVRYPIKSIVNKEDRLHIKYSILVKQTALSREMYVYWKRQKETNEVTGNMYDKVPSQILGNISCCNIKEEALGYFTASAVKTKRIFITPNAVNIETKDAYEGCNYDVMDGLPPWLYVLYNYWGHIIAVSDPKYKNFIGAEMGSQNLWCTDCRWYGWNEKPDFWED